MVGMVCSTAAFADYEKYQCTGNGVNVRNGPSIYSDSYGYLNNCESFWSQHDAVENNFRYGGCDVSTAISKAYGLAYLVMWHVGMGA